MGYGAENGACLKEGHPSLTRRARCLIPGFFPDNFLLAWLLNPKNSNLMKTKTTFSLFLLLGLTGLLGLAAEGPGDKPGKTRQSKVQIALLLDTSNSMDGLIQQAKATLWNLVNEFSQVRCRESRSPELEIALYEYGNDGLSPREGFIRQVLPFSQDLDEISQRLFSLTTNGGEEYCGQVIQTALRQLTWSKQPTDLKFIFIAGNEPFNQGQVAYEAVLEHSAEKDLVVNTIFCGDYELGRRTLWADGARRGRGEYSAIDHNRAVVHRHTPYDEIIIRLNRDLNATYIGYGRGGAEKKARQAAQDANALEMEAPVLVERAVSKSSAYYRNTGWDLVDAYKDESQKLSELDREGLPQELQNLSETELKSHLEQQGKRRREIQEEIRELNARREAYLSEEQDGEGSELQRALLEAVKKQAGRKDFRWVE